MNQRLTPAPPRRFLSVQVISRVTEVNERFAGIKAHYYLGGGRFTDLALMSDSKQEFEEFLFEAAAGKASAAQREVFLQEACRGNPALRSRLDALLEGHFAGKGFLTQAPQAEVASAMQTQEAPAQMIGRYKLLERIGEGGFGEVWMAEQREPVKRRVALKIIKLGMDTRQIVARFEAERQALALMDHPNIAKVFDAGATETGRPYFVMELVRGSKITDYCDKNTLSTQERLKLFILVCQAIQHAHQKGIIHRDIKPSNILVTLHDGVPVPKVIDFGIAKATQGELTDKTLFTQFQQFIGTPAYISPEQAETSGLDIDTRSDIYSLGVLLYEFLIGQTPFDAKEMTRGGIDALRRIIREKEPTKPSTKFKTLPAVELTTTAQRRQTDPIKLTHLLRGDLDWIVMKCLEKDRARRYETASGLAMDIQRYLTNEPIIARPPSTAYRVRKMVRRNKLAFTATAVVMLALMLGAIAVIFVQAKANREFREQLYVSEVNRAGLAWQAGRAEEMQGLLDKCPKDLRSWEWKFLHQQLDRWEQKEILSTTNLGSVALSADSRLLTCASRSGLEIYDYPSGQWQRRIPFTNEWRSPFRLSPNGELLATFTAPSGVVTIWKIRTGERVLELNHGSPGGTLDWFHDGKFLLTGGDDQTVRVWNVQTGKEARHFQAENRVFGLAVSPDDQAIAVGNSSTTIEVLDAQTGKLKRVLRSQGPFNSYLKFSPDGRLLVSGNGTAGGYRSDKRVWSLEDGGSLDLRVGAEVEDFSFRGDSRSLAVIDAVGIIHIWDLERRYELERFSAHIGRGTSVHLLPDDRILSAGSDGKVKIWQARRESPMQLKGYPNGLRSVAFSPDNRWLVAAGLASSLMIWDALNGFKPHPAGQYTNHAGGASAVAFSPDGRVASAGDNALVRLWDPSTLETIWADSLAPAKSAYWIAFSPDGKRLYAPSMQESLTVLDASTGQHLNSVGGLQNVLDGIAISPDGKLIALGQKSLLAVRSAEDLHELWRVAANPFRCVAFSPDGKWIASGDTDRSVSLWEVASQGRVNRKLQGHAGVVTGVSFHPDGTRLVSCSIDGQVKIWNC
jgi:WD40 repeat protein/serine/threonine protein kinase